jgi:O-antigen/teichoic acid export membrane protein
LFSNTVCHCWQAIFRFVQTLNSFKKYIFSTFAARFTIGIINLLLLTVSARVLGDVGRGIINLFVVHIAVIHTATELMAGPSVVFFATRIPSAQLRLIALTWSFFIVSFLSALVLVFQTLPREWIFLLWATSFLTAFTSIQMQLRAGREQLIGYNLITASIPILQIIFFLGAVYFLGPDLHHYFSSWLLALGVVSMAILPDWFKDFEGKIDRQSLQSSVLEMFSRGKWVFIANLFYTLAIRFSYLMIDTWQGKAMLGRFGTGVTITESVLVITGSMAFVVYAKIANAGKENVPDISRLNAMAFWLTTLVCIMLSLIPSALWTFILGTDFADVPGVIRVYAPAICILSISIVLSNYFGGQGLYHLSAFGSLSAFFGAVISGYFLVRFFGITGAAISIFCGHFAQLVCLLYSFQKNEKETTVVQFFTPLFKPYLLFK